MNDPHHGIEIGELRNVEDHPKGDDHPLIDDDAGLDHIIRVHHALIRGNFFLFNLFHHIKKGRHQFFFCSKQIFLKLQIEIEHTATATFAYTTTA